MDIHADNLVTGGNTLNRVRNVKKDSVELFQKQGFILHKWNSNVPALESNNIDTESELTYAKHISETTAQLHSCTSSHCYRNVLKSHNTFTV